ALPRALEGGGDELLGSVLLSAKFGERREAEVDIRAERSARARRVVQRDEEQRAVAPLRALEILFRQRELAERPEDGRVAGIDGGRELELSERLGRLGDGEQGACELVVREAALAGPAFSVGDDV